MIDELTAFLMSPWGRTFIMVFILMKVYIRLAKMEKRIKNIEVLLP